MLKELTHITDAEITIDDGKPTPYTIVEITKDHIYNHVDIIAYTELALDFDPHENVTYFEIVCGQEKAVLDDIGEIRKAVHFFGHREWLGSINVEKVHIRLKQGAIVKF